MNNFTVKIFGSPYIFDLYTNGNESENEKVYFDQFDDGSNEKRKLTIHRRVSGMVSYSYLRYRFITSGGRPGAFFGISVIFDSEYCTDIEKLYRLFDFVYDGYILKKSETYKNEKTVLFEEMEGNPNAQAKFLVRTFNEAAYEVNRIEEIITNNINTKFANDIRPLDASFASSNSMIKLKDKKGNDAFLSYLRKCSWVSISDEYVDPDPIPILSKEAIQKLKDNTIAGVKRINEMLWSVFDGKLIVLNDIEKLDSQIKEDKKTIAPYLEHQPEELTAIKKDLDKMQENLEKLRRTSSSSPPLSQQGIEKLDNLKFNTEPKNKQGKWLIKRRKTIIGWILGIAAVGSLLWWLFPDNPYPDKKQYSKLIFSGDSLLYNVTPFELKNVNEAISKYEAAKTLKVSPHDSIAATYKIANAKRTATDTIIARAKRKFAKKNIDAFNQAVKELNKIPNNNYGDLPDYIIEDYKKQASENYFSLIKEADQFSDIKKYLSDILSLDPDNATAKEKLQALNTVTLPGQSTEVGAPCYITLPEPYNTKVTIDGFLDQIEKHLNKPIPQSEYAACQRFCGYVINNQVVCPVSDDQRARAINLKKKPWQQRAVKR